MLEHSRSYLRQHIDDTWRHKQQVVSTRFTGDIYTEDRHVDSAIKHRIVSYQAAGCVTASPASAGMDDRTCLFYERPACNALLSTTPQCGQPQPTGARIFQCRSAASPQFLRGTGGRAGLLEICSEFPSRRLDVKLRQICTAAIFTVGWIQHLISKIREFTQTARSMHRLSSSHPRFGRNSRREYTGGVWGPCPQRGADSCCYCLKYF